MTVPGSDPTSCWRPCTSNSLCQRTPPPAVHEDCRVPLRAERTARAARGREPKIRLPAPASHPPPKSQYLIYTKMTGVFWCGRLFIVAVLPGCIWENAPPNIPLWPAEKSRRALRWPVRSMSGKAVRAPARRRAVSTFCKIISDQKIGARVNGRPGEVVKQKGAPRNFRHAGQQIHDDRWKQEDEPRDEYRLGAVPFKESLRPAGPFLEKMQPGNFCQTVRAQPPTQPEGAGTAQKTGCRSSRCRRPQGITFFSQNESRSQPDRFSGRGKPGLVRNATMKTSTYQ